MAESIRTMVAAIVSPLKSGERLSPEERVTRCDEVAFELRRLPSRDAATQCIGLLADRKWLRDYKALLCSILSDEPLMNEYVRQLLAAGDIQLKKEFIFEVGMRALPNLDKWLCAALSVESDPDLLSTTVWAAGQSRSRSCIAQIRALAADHPQVELRRVAIRALVELEDDGSMDAIKKQFEDSTVNSTDRMIAACGLARTGDVTALKLLISKLRERDFRSETEFRPGESIAAAKWLCQALHWPFEWNKGAVSTTLDRLMIEYPELLRG